VSDLSLLYNTQLYEHGRSPRQYGLRPDLPLRGNAVNQLCGDTITWGLACDDQGVITQARFEASACLLTVAAASLLSEQLIGKSIAQLRTTSVELVHQQMPNAVTFSRRGCVELVHTALLAALEQYA
jgi:nitrogen fixation NifU-like protein